MIFSIKKKKHVLHSKVATLRPKKEIKMIVTAKISFENKL